MNQSARDAAAGLRAMLATDGLFSDADWRGRVKALVEGLEAQSPMPATEAIVQDADKVRAAITGMLSAEGTEVALAAYGRLVAAAARGPELLDELTLVRRERDGEMQERFKVSAMARRMECRAEWAETERDDWKHRHQTVEATLSRVTKERDTARESFEQQRVARVELLREAGAQHAQARADVNAITIHLGGAADKTTALPPPSKAVCDIIGRIHEAQAERDAYRKGLVAVAEFASQGGSGVPPSTYEYEEAIAAVARLWNGKDELRKQVSTLEAEVEAARAEEAREGGIAERALAARDTAEARVKELEAQGADVWNAAVREAAQTAGDVAAKYDGERDAIDVHTGVRIANVVSAIRALRFQRPPVSADIPAEAMRPWTVPLSAPRLPAHWVDFALTALPEAMRAVCLGHVVTAPGDEVQATAARVAGDVADAMVARIADAKRHMHEAGKTMGQALTDVVKSTKP